MKFQHTLPENEGFFSRYAGLIPTLHKLGYLAQTVQALTEITIVYAVVYSRAAEFSPANAVTIAATAAVCIPLVLAVGLRTFLTYSVRAILYKLYTGLDAWMTGFIFTITAALLLCSGALSFEGSRDMIEVAAPPPAKESTDQADARRDKDAAAIAAKFSTDSATLAATYAAKIAAAKGQHDARIRAEQLTAGRAKTKESKAAAWGRIEGIRAERKAAVSTLEGERADALAALFSAKESRFAVALEDHRRAADKIDAGNTAALQKFQQRTNKYGGLLAWFTLFCLAFATFSIALYEMHRKGSGIAIVAQPSQRHFSQGVISEFKNAISEKADYHLRAVVRAIENATPAPHLPTAPATLYDIAQAQQARLKMKSEHLEAGEIVLPARPIKGLPQATAGAMATTQGSTEKGQSASGQAAQAVILAFVETSEKLRAANLHKDAEEYELKAVEVIAAYLGPDATQADISALYDAVVLYVKNEGPNPFERHHRTVVQGFVRRNQNQTQEPPAAPPYVMRMTQNVVRNTSGEKGGKISVVTKACGHCGNSFERRTTFQKYCSEDCRKAAWEQKNGRPPMMRKNK